MYAEYLPKLQKISIVIGLPTPSEWKTKVTIGKDANTLHVYHDQTTTMMALPVTASIQDEHLGFGNKGISPGHTKLSWRIKPADAVIKAAKASFKTGDGVARVPWTAADLTVDVDVVCRKCRTVILSKGKLKEWKNLPSENWAEMMEFWHCHKPTNTISNKEDNHDTDSYTENRDQSKTSDDQLASRAYGANSAISAKSGVGFADLTKFLFYGEDCRGSVVSNNHAWVCSIVHSSSRGITERVSRKVTRRKVFGFLPCLSVPIQMPKRKSFSSSCLVQATEELANPRLGGVVRLF